MAVKRKTTAALVLLLRYGRVRRERESSREEIKKLLARYQARDEEDMRRALEEHKLLWEAMEQAEKEELRCRSAFESARSAHSEIEENALQQLDFLDGNSEAAVLSRRLTTRRSEVEALSQQIAAMGGRLAAMGDPLVQPDTTFIAQTMTRPLGQAMISTLAGFKKEDPIQS